VSGRFSLRVLALEPIQVQEDGENDMAWTTPVWFEPGGQIVPAQPQVRMIRLLPNPTGSDAEDESITIKNLGAASVSLLDWSVRDLANKRS
jgi:hypothetical protein